jgi:hypothetical protein
VACVQQLLRELSEFLVEFVNTASSIHELHFTGEEGVTVSRNFHFNQWILVAVFPSDFLFGINARAAQERVVGRDVLEHNEAITFWMNTFFHIISANNCDF